MANFVANSLLAAFLVEQFAWGHFSPQLIQKIAALACADFDRAREQEESSLDDLRNLAQLGSRGAFPNNVHRDLMARMSAQVHLPEPFAINMPFKAPLGDRLQSVLLPHEMFASLYHDYPEAWKNIHSSRHCNVEYVLGGSATPSPAGKPPFATAKSI